MTIRTMMLVFSLLLSGLFLGGCESGPQAGARAAEPVAVQRTVQEYTLGPGDKVRVTVFGEPELSGEFTLDGKGIISLPLIGEIPVQGATVRELQRAAEQRLANGYLRQPQVSAEVLNFRPFYILGEVNKPGEYPYSEGLTVINAIARAEGFSYRANQRVVEIKGSRDANYSRIELTPTTVVLPGDTIRVLERFF
jgi:polysaccharide export outer membrane protein